ncbi:MAG TPA: permease [Anaerolineaceae bacterium]|nr:permease [Anaerolineaceae bacterium]HPN54124.1 permease [Anaerolineaceae bacterium]
MSFAQLTKKFRSFFVPGAVLLLVFLVVSLSYWPLSAAAWGTFTTIFLGIFIEAVPFLMIGTFASGLVEVYVAQDTIQKWTPKSPLLSAFAGSILGLFFPVCECGVVPLVRRLFRKGLPIPTGVAFLLAAPIINPIVILSTATAFGFGQMLLMRVGFALVVSVITGLVFATAGAPQEILRSVACAPSTPEEQNGHHHDFQCQHCHDVGDDYGQKSKMSRVFQVSLEEFYEIGRFLVLGAAIAAGMQTLIPQNILLDIGRGPVLSVLVMMVLAVLLSICSTVDSFVALGFVNIFSTGSVLGFLLFGPMVDIKSVLMFLQVFRGRAVLYLVSIPLVLAILISVSLNYFASW